MRNRNPEYDSRNSIFAPPRERVLARSHMLGFLLVVVNEKNVLIQFNSSLSEQTLAQYNISPLGIRLPMNHHWAKLSVILFQISNQCHVSNSIFGVIIFNKHSACRK